MGASRSSVISITIFTHFFEGKKGFKKGQVDSPKRVQVKRGVASFLNFIAIFGSLGPRVTTRNNMRCRRQKVLLTAVCCCFWDLPISWDVPKSTRKAIDRRYLDPLQNWKQNAYYIYSLIISLVNHIYASIKKEIQSVSLDFSMLGVGKPHVFPLLEPRFYRNLNGTFLKSSEVLGPQISTYSHPTLANETSHFGKLTINMIWTSWNVSS